MTCVVGATDGGTVILGADSAGGSGDEMYTIASEKVFTRGPYVFGVCGSYRVGQILRYRVNLPRPPAAGDLEPFLIRRIVPLLRHAVQAEGVVGPGRTPLGETTALLVGCRGQLWHVGPDLTVLPEAAFGGAIGSGRLRAYGALHALWTAGIEPPMRRLELALEAAAAFTANVRPPWHFVTVPPDYTV